MKEQDISLKIIIKTTIIILKMGMALMDTHLLVKNKIIINFFVFNLLYFVSLGWTAVISLIITEQY